MTEVQSYFSPNSLLSSQEKDQALMAVREFGVNVEGLERYDPALTQIAQALLALPLLSSDYVTVHDLFLDNRKNSTSFAPQLSSTHELIQKIPQSIFFDILQSLQSREKYTLLSFLVRMSGYSKAELVLFWEHAHPLKHAPISWPFHLEGKKGGKILCNSAEFYFNQAIDTGGFMVLRSETGVSFFIKLYGKLAAHLAEGVISPKSIYYDDSFFTPFGSTRKNILSAFLREQYVVEVDSFFRDEKGNRFDQFSFMRMAQAFTDDFDAKPRIVDILEDPYGDTAYSGNDRKLYVVPQYAIPNLRSTTPDIYLRSNLHDLEG